MAIEMQRTPNSAAVSHDSSVLSVVFSSR